MNTKANITEIDVIFHYFFYPVSVLEVSSTSKTAGETIFIGCLIQKHRIIEYLKLEGTHKDDQVQLPAPHRTT